MDRDNGLLLRLRLSPDGISRGPFLLLSMRGACIRVEGRLHGESRMWAGGRKGLVNAAVRMSSCVQTVLLLALRGIYATCPLEAQILLRSVL